MRLVVAFWSQWTAAGAQCKEMYLKKRSSKRVIQEDWRPYCHPRCRGNVNESFSSDLSHISNILENPDAQRCLKNWKIGKIHFVGWISIICPIPVYCIKQFTYFLQAFSKTKVNPVIFIRSIGFPTLHKMSKCFSFSYSDTPDVFDMFGSVFTKYTNSVSLRTAYHSWFTFIVPIAPMLMFLFWWNCMQ